MHGIRSRCPPPLSSSNLCLLFPPMMPHASLSISASVSLPLCLFLPGLAWPGRRYLGYRTSFLGVEGHLTALRMRGRQTSAYADMARKGWDSLSKAKEMADMAEEERRKVWTLRKTGGGTVCCAVPFPCRHVFGCREVWHDLPP